MMIAVLTCLVFVSCGESDDLDNNSVINGDLSTRKVTIDGLIYYLYPDSHEAVIDNDNTWTGELDIPSKVSYNGLTFTVSSMTWLAFSDCTELTKVRIPKTIEHVIHHVLTDNPENGGAVSSDCMNPFERCTALESIEVDDDNPIMKSVGGILFSKDGKSLYCYPAGNKAEQYVVPEGVTKIGADAFGYNEHLVSLKLPATVETLKGAFWGCKRLEEVNLPEKLTYLEAYMFAECSSLKSIEIPSGVKGLGESVFRNCASLKTIILPESVQTIGNYAFSGCMLDALVIKGTLDSQSADRYLFDGLNESAIVYVPVSEIERYKGLFTGSVLPLEDFVSEKAQCSHNY